MWHSNRKGESELSEISTKPIVAFLVVAVVNFKTVL
jgi:hypothetical protein